MSQSDYQEVLWDWRSYFTDENLRLGERDAANGKLSHFSADPDGRWAKAMTDGAFIVQVVSAPANYVEYRSYPDWHSLTASRSGRRSYTHYYLCNCSVGKLGSRCRHLAALLFHWEKVHGPFVMHEDPAAREARLKAEREKKERERKEKDVFPASNYFAERFDRPPKGLYYSPDSILLKSCLKTNQYEAELADQLISESAVSDFSMINGFYERREQRLMVQAKAGGNQVNITVDRKTVTELHCDCRRCNLHNYYGWNSGRVPLHMCGHALVTWSFLREAIIRDNPGDETDYNGDRLLSLLTGQRDAPEASQTVLAVPVRKRQDVVLQPRIVRDRSANALKLAFDLGRAGSKAYAVKSLEGLVKAVEGGTEYALSKNASLSFAEETFTEDSETWYQLITSRVRAVKSVNDRLRGGYYYESRSLSVGTGIPLEESDLDIVYDMVEGSQIQYQYGTRSEVCTVRVGAAHPRAELRLDPMQVNGQLQGIRLTGALPRLLRGNLYQYILNRECFGRVNDDELDFLRPFQTIGNGSDTVSGVVGKKKFAEFYYRVLPALLDTPQLEVIDGVSALISGLVPPEPQFTFYIDLEGERVTCRSTVEYAERVYPLPLPPNTLPRETRDTDQEQRVLEAMQGFFPNRSGDNLFTCPADEDHLVWILTEGVRALSKLGEVKGSDAFNRVHVLPPPQTRFSVQVEGGLLDLSIKTRDMSEEELIELLASYRKRKRWHRLRSGDFVDLDGDALAELDDTARAMDASLEDLVHGGVKLPAYRALYVDRLLEAHNDITASRDRHFKALIRSFQTIKDSDFDAPGALADVLRPYQLYGFRWLCTLSQAGFGGILADEMGLGKTVQALAYLQLLRDQSETRPALVVCPASLVYNWKDECRRFTPGLRVETVAGTLPQRKKLLARAGEDADLYITSYDLLKRDITLYGELEFSCVILDEAQFVKNHRSAASKAVRVLRAEHRFALTGTPIENRLSELWSIFDFLMPGFLYAQSEFASRFEGPIMKQKDTEATQRLARMTEPFILRRRKGDVLKDLPEKLEEDRRAELEGEQRRLYDAQVVRMRDLLEATGDSGEDKLRILAEITRLRQLCCDPALLFEDYRGPSAKREACLELIQSAIDAGHRLLVFSQFTSMLSLLAADLKGADIPFYTLTGATPKQERIRLVNAFNGNDVPVFLISLKAGGTGLNLTGADVVLHYDPWWNLAAQNQATDRAHRIGQTRQVTVIKLIAADTIEERIVRLQETKRDLAEAILTGQNTSLMSLSREELLSLLG